MVELIDRIRKAIKKASDDASCLINNEVPHLAVMRNHQRILTLLLTDLTKILKQGKYGEMHTYMVRRRKQAEKFRKARMVSGMTAKDAEEESKRFDEKKGEEDLWTIECEAASTYDELDHLYWSLSKMIDFCQDCANDAKSIEKMLTPHQ